MRGNLLGVVVVNVAIAAGPDEVAYIEIALLRDHVREQGVAGDVERHAEEEVGAALIKLAGEARLGQCVSESFLLRACAVARCSRKERRGSMTRQDEEKCQRERCTNLALGGPKQKVSREAPLEAYVTVGTAFTM